MKSGLQVITNDIPVSLFLNEQYLDKSPYINKEIKPGKYSLKIVPEDTQFASYETNIALNKGLLTVVTWKPGQTPETSGGVIYELEPLSNKKQTEISFITIPDNTIITFDHQEPEFAPLIIDSVEPGHHEFEITLPSYETQKHTINVVEGHRLIVSAKLAKSGETSESPQNAQPSPSKEATPGSQVIPEVTIATLAASEEAKLNTEPIDGDTVQILSTGYYQDGVEVLKIRDASSSAGKEIGFAQVKKKYKYLNDTQNGWYKIEFDGKEGWVSGSYAQLILATPEK